MIMSYINGLERRVQRAAPGSYHGIAALFFGACIYAAAVLFFSFQDRSAGYDTETNLIRGLLACATLFCGYVGRLSFIMLLRSIRAPYQAGAPVWTTIVASLGIVVLLGSLTDGYIIESQVLSSAWHSEIRLLAWLMWTIAGGRARQVQLKIEKQQNATIDGTAPVGGTQKGGSTFEEREELSTIDQAIADIHDPDFKKKGGIITVHDMRLSILGRIGFECLYGYLFYYLYGILQTLRQESKTSGAVPSGVFALIGVALAVVGAMLIFMPVWTVRSYLKWKARMAADAVGHPTTVEDAEKQ